GLSSGETRKTLIAPRPGSRAARSTLAGLLGPRAVGVELAAALEQRGGAAGAGALAVLVRGGEVALRGPVERLGLLARHVGVADEDAQEVEQRGVPRAVRGGARGLGVAALGGELVGLVGGSLRLGGEAAPAPVERRRAVLARELL